MSILPGIFFAKHKDHSTTMLKDVNIRMQNYDEALAWLTNEVENPVSYTDSVCALIDLVDVLAMQQDSTCKNGNLQSPAARLVNLPDSLLGHSFDLFHPALFIEKRNQEAEELPGETKNPLSFVIIPNPVSVSEVQLKFEKLKNAAIHLECCNMAGQTIQVMQILVDEQGTAWLKLPDALIPGTYILMATSQNQQFNVSFIKN